ncbi:MAG TPA: CBS domain-containing protein [Gemmatimonadaceae bacterium]
MLRLRDIMTTELVSVSPELSLRDAMELFVTHHVSGAPVVAQHRVVGVVSVTDLLGFVAGAPGFRDEVRFEASLDELETNAEPGEGDEPMANWFVELPTDESSDVVEQFNETGSRRPAIDRFAEHTVSEVMNDNVCSLPSGTRVDQAADFMRNAGIHRVLVMDDGALVGIVSMKDIADAVADHRLTERTYVFGGKSAVERRPTPRWSR